LLTYNRLDSRQRKKKHTESLEDEKKAWTERNVQLETDMKELNVRFEGLLRETQNLHSINQTLEHQVQSLQNEKEEMISKHTLESGELRRKISVLRDQLESSPASQPSHPSDYTDFATELEGLNMSSEGDWSNWVTDFADVEHSQAVQSKSNGAETTLVVGQRRKDTLMSEVSDKQMVPGGGFLLLFLLYGAFVATRATGSAPLPPMSDEYRAEAEMILNNVLDDDTGVQQSSMAMLQAVGSGNVQQVNWPAPSNTQSGSRPTFSQPANAGGLNTLSQRLLAPSKQQEAEAAFSMTPAQYNAITSGDFSRRSYENNEENARSKGTRKPLAELIRASREEDPQGSNMADVYTRSLMWDRIPTEVVQEFKRMVSRCPSVDEQDIKAEFDE
jgi:hypothetical protein